MKKIISIIIVLFLILTGGYFLLDNLSIRSIEISGNDHNSDSEIMKIVGINEDSSLFDAYFKIERKIEDRAYISRLRVEHPNFFDLKIEIIEKDIIGYIEYLNSYLCIDSNAYIIDNVKKPDKDKPIIKGIKIKSFSLNEPIDISDEIKISLLNTYKTAQTFKVDIDYIDFENLDNESLSVGKKGVRVQLGKPVDLDIKFQALHEIMLKMDKDAKGTLYLEDPYGKIIFKNRESL